MGDAMTVSFILYLVVVALILAALWLGGTAFMRWLGLGDPWPRVLALLIAAVVVASIVSPLLGVRRLWPVGAP